MRDKVFIDTNVFVYTTLEDEAEGAKFQKAIKLIKQLSNHETVVSIQVLNEFYCVLVKHKVPENEIQDKLNTIIEDSTLALIRLDTIRSSWQIRMKYRFSLWDSLIIASAVENGCSILYTEDLQHNQLIGDRLEIINPFI